MNYSSGESLDLTIQILKSVLPEVDWLLEHMESSQGWLNFHPQFAENLIQWKLPQWSQFYLDERKLKALGVMVFYDEELLKNISPEQRDEFKYQSKEDLLSFIHDMDEFPLPNPDEVREIFESADEEEKQSLTRSMVVQIYAFITATFNYLSLMTQGQTLCSLVSMAQSDSDNADKALCQAIRIDRTILTLPFVQNRLMKAQLGKDGSFLEMLGNSIKRPILGGKIRYRKLWLTFAILEDEGFLSIPHELLLDLLEEIGVYGSEFGVEDVGHLRNRLFEYRKKSPLAKKNF